MNDDIENILDRIATALENIHEQLEIMNSPKANKEFNRWYYDWQKRIGNTKQLIKFYTEVGDHERVKRYEENLKQLKTEQFEG